MVTVLTFIVVLSLKNFRRDVQILYFVYFNELSQKTGLKLLGKRTVVIRNVEHMDNEGVQLKTIVDGILSKNDKVGKMFGCIFLPDYSKSYKLESRNRQLEFFNELYRSKKFNRFSEFFLPKNITKKEEYIKDRRRLALKIKNGVGTQPNSGYSFACFSSFEAISTLQKCVEQ